jgi:hypothetical protein
VPEYSMLFKLAAFSASADDCKVCACKEPQATMVNRLRPKTGYIDLLIVAPGSDNYQKVKTSTWSGAIVIPVPIHFAGLRLSALN